MHLTFLSLTFLFLLLFCTPNLLKNRFVLRFIMTVSTTEKKRRLNNSITYAFVRAWCTLDFCSSQPHVFICYSEIEYRIFITSMYDVLHCGLFTIDPIDIKQLRIDPNYVLNGKSKFQTNLTASLFRLPMKKKSICNEVMEKERISTKEVQARRSQPRSYR